MNRAIELLRALRDDLESDFLYSGSDAIIFYAARLRDRVDTILASAASEGE